jgi:flagellar FliJ protein
MAFQFRFASLLKIHRRSRDEAGAEVGKASRAIEKIDQQIRAILAERKAMQDRSTQSRVGNIAVDQILAQGRYDLQLQAETNALHETRRQLEQELERRQQILRAAESEVKRFERLLENERATYHAEQLKREQAAADDASSARYLIRSRQS